MRKIALLAIVVIATIGSVATVMAYGHYSLQNYPATNGYDPNFLQDPEVKQVCKDAVQDLSKYNIDPMGYCSEKLGTLP